ncbi:MAG: TonB-dependent receptor [Gammaproteobacteria bacterium]|nr:TonB-dependent receptor [Gammaproteobacteria bacterium]
MSKTLLRALVALSLLASLNSYSQQAGLTEDADESDLEVVIVTGVRIGDALQLNSSQVSPTGIDNGDLLRLFPGGNRNSNGPVTRISQYRGLFGAQNNISIDGLGYKSGCPNWMDSPLSAIPQSQTQSVTLSRGLGSVAVIEEGLGGSIAIDVRREGFSERDGWGTFGRFEAGSGSNASSWGGSLYTGVNNQDNWLDVAASFDKGDDYEFNGGTVAATEYDRKQYRFGYGHRFTGAEISLGAVINRTGESGTPALPMDIIYIDSEQYSLAIDTTDGEGDLSFKINTTSVDHVMNNFTLRPPPTAKNGMKTLRSTLATGDNGDFKLTYDRAFGENNFLFGVDGKRERHDADLSNPANDMFYITMFNGIKRDRYGVFGQLTRVAGDWGIEAGLRYNSLTMNADEVGGNLAMMGGMPMPVTQQDRLDALAAAFNESDRHKKNKQFSAILKASRELGNGRLNLGVGRKVRSPSYQERYLWLPMEATSGLADGYTYLGDIDLKPETSIELTAGVDWAFGRFKLTPEAYYRDVSNYIQGVPSTNPVANQFAFMMSGRLPLQYANVDAELYGFDMGYEFEIDASWLLRGNLGYVRGKRKDVKDNLYRIAPLSSFLELSWRQEKYFLAMENVAASKQQKVSVYNDEQPSAGWGILNVRGGYNLNNIFVLNLGVENLFDKAYQDHLGGYNRVIGSDVPLRERLYSKGRNYYIKLNANW